MLGSKKKMLVILQQRWSNS